MSETTLQIYCPELPASVAEAAAEALPEGLSQQVRAKTLHTSAWQRGVWWLSLFVMLPVGLGVLQMLALVVQAERVRSALEEGLAIAHLPKAYLRDVELAIISRPGSRQLFEHLRTANDPKYNLVVKCPYRTNYLSGMGIFPIAQNSSDNLVTADLSVSISTLLPRWLGPLLPFVGADEVHVHWEVIEGQE